MYMKRLSQNSYLILIPILAIILVGIACATESIDDLTCASIIEQAIDLGSQEEDPIKEITDVQELSRLSSKLECKGIAKTETGETTPIVFHEEDVGDSRYYGVDALQISHWGCDYLVKFAIETAQDQSFEIKSIVQAETITDSDERLQCAGTAVMGNGDRVDLEFYVEPDITGEYAWFVGFYSGEPIEYHNNTLLYIHPITEDTAQRLFDYLKGERGFFDQDSEIDVQLRKEGGSFEFRMVIKEGLDIESISPLLAEMACELKREIFSGSNVDLVAVAGKSLTGFDDIIRREICME